MTKDLKVADFVEKLYSILENEDNQDIICWADSQFVIKNPQQLINTLLPKYFRHSKLQSFVRQLNLYGFKKLTKPHSKQKMFFKNDKFKKGCPELLIKIQLKNKSKGEQEQDFQSLSKIRLQQLNEKKSNFRSIVDSIYQQLKTYQNYYPQLQESMTHTLFLLKMCGVKEQLGQQMIPQMSVTNFLTKFNLEFD